MIRVPVRVLVLDVSAANRRLVRDVLAADARIVVVGTAASGPAALAKVAELRPDAIILDVEMSIKDDAAYLRQLRAAMPELLVVVLCAATEGGAAMALAALVAGASEFVRQPGGSLGEQLIPRLVGLNDARRLAAQPTLPRSALPIPYPTSAAFHEAGPLAVPALPEDHQQQLAPFLVAAPFPLPGRRALLPSVPGLPGQRIARPVQRERVNRAAGPGQHAPLDDDFGVLTIGAATGGPQALAELLAALPADLPVPVLVVQSMPALFTRVLAGWLDSCCLLSVTEATEGDLVAPGRVLIAPGGRHLEVRNRGSAIIARLTDSPPETSHRPSVDVLFRSAAAVFRHRTLGVVLTGLGRDGVQGATAIRTLGGEVFAQDEASSVIWGMPGAVVGAGQADRVLPLPELADEIVSLVRRSQETTAASAGAGLRPRPGTDPDSGPDPGPDPDPGGGRHQRVH